MRIEIASDSAVEKPRPVIAVAKTANQKTGPVSITYVSQHSCPQECPWRGSGCYAEYGPIGRLTRRLNAAVELDPVRLARLEASLIDGLPADRDLRLHGVGDCRTRQAAQLVSAAARRYIARARKMAKLGYADSGVAVWNYTHAWRTVPVASWHGVSVLASVETHADALTVLEKGYAPALVIEEHSTHKAHKFGEVTVIPCPNQTKGVTCDECRLCLDAPKLRNRSSAIAFAAHGTNTRRVRMSLRVLQGS